jgi:hypothetical protein
MKTSLLAIVSCLAIAVTAAAADLQIEYGSAGLTSVKVDERSRLHFAWHTGRLDTPLSLQSLDGYDSHSAVIWLTKAEMEKFRQWIEQNRILDLKPEYPEPEQKTYGSAFQSSLSVELDRKKKSLAWSGDTKVPDTLHAAINALVKMCHEIRQTREAK